MFRPKRSIMDPLLPKGVHYEDTLENFLKLALDKLTKEVVELDINRGSPPQGEPECTT